LHLLVLNKSLPRELEYNPEELVRERPALAGVEQQEATLQVIA
jgi:hypothetical protein